MPRPRKGFGHRGLTGSGAVPTLASAMVPEARVLGLQCLRCHTRFQEPRLFTGCPHCRAQGVAVNLTVEYDLSPLAGVTPETFGTAARGLWRFRHLLPVRAANPVTLGEGATPLVHLERVGRRLGLPRLYAKDESQNPTWSYKDRLCATAVTHAVETGARVITISSTGNHGASTAAYAARAGVPCVIFTLASVPETMKTLMQAYGAAGARPREARAAHDRRRALRSPRPRARARPSGSGAGRRAGAVRRLFHRLTLRDVAGTRRVARVERRRCAIDRRGRAGGSARSRARGRPLCRALGRGIADRRHTARRAWRARRGADDRRRPDLRRLERSGRQPRVAAAGAGRRRRLRSPSHRPPRGLWTGAGPIASASRSGDAGLPVAPPIWRAPPSARGSAASGSSRTTSILARMRSRPRRRR